MKTAPVKNPREVTPVFDYAIRFCNYHWVASIDECGRSCKSLAPSNYLTRRLDPSWVGVEVYQVHELPVLDEVKC